MPSENPRQRLQDIVDNIGRIQSYTAGMDEEGFMSSELVADAVERCLARISEAGVKLEPLNRALLPTHDWDAVRGFGNFLRHEYDRVNRVAIWLTIENDLPALRKDCLAAIARMEAGEEP